MTEPRETSVSYITPGPDGKDQVCVKLQPNWKRIAARHAEEIKGSGKMLPENSLKAIRDGDMA